MPELIASALAAAVEEGKLLLLDFHAGWCAPCIVLDRETANRYRHMGIIDAEDLVRELANLSKAHQPTEAP